MTALPSAARRQDDADDLGLALTSLDADRLRLWSARLREYGPNVSEWGSHIFVAEMLVAIAERAESTIRDVGTLRSLRDAAPAQDETPASPAQAPAEPKHVVKSHWMHTHGDVLEYECSCGVEWVEDAEPAAHKALRDSESRFTVSEVSEMADACSRGRAGGPWIDWAKCETMLRELQRLKQQPERWSMTFGELPDAVRPLIESHLWDNKNISEQRDWAVSELQRLLAAQKEPVKFQHVELAGIIDAATKNADGFPEMDIRLRDRLVLALDAHVVKAAQTAPPAEPPKEPNPCPRCGTFLWGDTRPCWNCARATPPQGEEPR